MTKHTIDDAKLTEIIASAEESGKLDVLVDLQKFINEQRAKLDD